MPDCTGGSSASAHGRFFAQNVPPAVACLRLRARLRHGDGPGSVSVHELGAGTATSGACPTVEDLPRGMASKTRWSSPMRHGGGRGDPGRPRQISGAVRGGGRDGIPSQGRSGAGALPLRETTIRAQKHCTTSRRRQLHRDYTSPGTREEPVIGEVVRALEQAHPMDSARRVGTGTAGAHVEYCDLLEQADRNVYQHAAKRSRTKRGSPCVHGEVGRALRRSGLHRTSRSGYGRPGECFVGERPLGRSRARILPVFRRPHRARGRLTALWAPSSTPTTVPDASFARHDRLGVDNARRNPVVGEGALSASVPDPGADRTPTRRGPRRSRRASPASRSAPSRPSVQGDVYAAKSRTRVPGTSAKRSPLESSRVAKRRSARR